MEKLRLGVILLHTILLCVLEVPDMKRILILILASLLAVGAVSAQAKSGGLEPLMAPGDLAITAGIGYGFFWGAIDVSGGIELMMGKFMIGDTVPLTWGLAAKAAYFGYSYNTDYHYNYLGAGGFATLHFGLKSLNLPDGMDFLANTDWYIGLGAGFYNYSESYYGDTSGSGFRVGFRSVGGVSYFFSPNFAINFEGGYYGGWSGGLIGVLFKI